MPFFTVENPYLDRWDAVWPVVSAALWFGAHHVVFGGFKRLHGVDESYIKSMKARNKKETKVDEAVAKRDEEEMTKLKLTVVSWRAFQYIFSCCFGLVVLSQCYWTLTPRLYFEGFPYHPMTLLEKLYYQMGYGMSMFSLLYLPFEPIRLKDFSVYAVHHFVTLALIHTSYIYGFHRIGAAVLLCHDIADPFMELAKCFLYKKKEAVANFLFASFAVTFMFTRIFILPYYITSSLFLYGYHEDGTLMPHGNYIINYACRAWLITLQCMHIYWSVLLLKVIVRLFTSKGLSDVRDKTD